jgi:hypothetical protein
LKELWCALTDDEKHIWEQWEAWDAMRYQHQYAIYETQSRAKKSNTSANDTKSGALLQHVPKKKMK